MPDHSAICFCHQRYRKRFGGTQRLANVYRLDPASDEATVVVSDMARPNGLCFSPDVVDTGQGSGKPHPINVYDVVEGRKLVNGRMFCDMGKGGSDGPT